MAMVYRPAVYLRIWPYRAEFFQIRARDKHSGLAAAKHKAAQVGAIGELANYRLQFGEDGLAERVCTTSGLVEG
jgi:hypothetical protein